MSFSQSSLSHINVILPAFARKVQKKKPAVKSPKFSLFSPGQIHLTKAGFKVKVDNVECRY
jgi:hypothetical protein